MRYTRAFDLPMHLSRQLNSPKALLARDGPMMRRDRKERSRISLISSGQDPSRALCYYTR